MLGPHVLHGEVDTFRPHPKRCFSNVLKMPKYLQPYVWGEFTQLTAAAATLWITAAIAIVLSTFARLHRRVASSLIVVTFGALVLALQVVWAPFVIPYLSHII